MILITEQIRWIDRELEKHEETRKQAPADPAAANGADLEVIKAIKTSLEQLQLQQKYLGIRL